MSRRALWVAVPWVALTTTLFGLYAASARPAREVARQTFPGVVLLMMADASGRTISIGSGFFVEPDVVATSLHVIANTSRGYAKRIGEETLHPLGPVVTMDAQNDLVLIRVDGVTAPPLPLGSLGTVAVGDNVFAVGSPRGYEGTFSEGIVSGIRTTGGTTLLQITSPIAQGSSGGPVVNTRGEVIGITASLVEGAQNLNFALPVSYLRSLLSRATAVALPAREPPPPAPTFEKLTRLTLEP